MSASITLTVSDGTTSVTLATSTTNKIADYTPEPIESGKQTVAETARITFRNTSLANVLTDLHNLELLFTRARAWRASGAGARVYVTFQYDTAVTSHRALIRDGDVKYNAEGLRYGILDFRFECAVMWEREEYEDATASIPQIALLNSSVEAKTTNALTIFNHDDSPAGHDDFAEIAAADVGGVIGAGMYLVITASVAATFTKYYIGHSPWITYTNFPHFLEGVGSNDADCSGGTYLAITGIATAWSTPAVTWTLSDAQVLACAGRPFHLLARFRTLPGSGIICQVQSEFPSTAVMLEETPILALSTTEYLQDLGVLHIPPWLPGEGALRSIDINAYFYRTGANATLDLDYIALMPADSWRAVTLVGVGVGNGEVLTIDDTSSAIAYHTLSGAISGQVAIEGFPLRLEPNKLQRIYILCVRSDGSAPIADTHTLKLYARIRKPAF